MDKMFIEGLQLEAIIGIHSHERTQKQPLSIDIELNFDSTKAAQHDHIDHALDYEKIVTATNNYLQANPFFLLETLANGLAQHLQQKFDLETIILSVFKPHAIPSAKQVGIQVERHKNSPPPFV
jgi:dihydroneopterin aldolase